MRILHWQDIHVAIEREEGLLSALINSYRAEATRMIDDGGLLFPGKEVDPRDARMILHPPGYPILIAAIYGGQTSSGSYQSLRLVQAICDSAAAVMIFLIAAELFPMALAVLAGLLVALSPHLAHYSLWLSPDTLAALPILIAVFLIIKASKRPRLIYIIAAGIWLGLSCWLRSNGLLLAIFLVPAMLMMFGGKKGWRYSAAMVGACLVVISPITIRNFMVYKKMIPLSLGAGITLVEGIADYDREGRHGMPQTDRETAERDAEWHNREDYRGNIWVPDGVERDGERMRRGVEVIRSNPIWFGGVMIRRMASMLRYNDSLPEDWMGNIGARVPVVSAEPPFMHEPLVSDDLRADWASDPAKMIQEGALLSPLAEIGLSSSGEMLEVRGDGSGFDDQFGSAPIPVEKNTDYVLWLEAMPGEGKVAAKVTSIDRRITLAASHIEEPADRPKKKSRRKAEQEAEEDFLRDGSTAPNESEDSQASVLQMPFASGNRTAVRLVISNNDINNISPVVELGEARLFSIGPTPGAWAGLLRAPIRGLQKYLFDTSRMLALVASGILLLLLARRHRALVILLAVPAYYLCLQSAFHTEYRYILGIHYFLFVIAATALYLAAVMAVQGAGVIKREALKRIPR